jgi:hypothetical protein
VKFPQLNARDTGLQHILEGCIGAHQTILRGCAGDQSLFVRLVADGWCWFVLREKYCWLVAGGWFVLREKYYWLVSDKSNEQGAISLNAKLN